MTIETIEMPERHWLQSLCRVIVGMVAAAVTFTCALPASAADEPKEKSLPAADGPKGPAEPLDVGPKGKPQSVAVDLKRLGTELDLYAAEANRNRLASALIGLGIGSALVPSGLLLLGRTDGISRALVIGMIVGGSAQLLSVPLQLIPTRMDEIRDEFIGRPVSVESKATIREIENEWREAAEGGRRKRLLVGTTMFVVGSACLTTGLALLLAPEGVLGMSRKTQYTWGGMGMGFGVPVTTISVRLLLEWSLEETSWEAYRTMKSDAGSLARLRLRPPSLGLLPMTGGALAFATMPF
jgi:hypothetical protein